MRNTYFKRMRRAAQAELAKKEAMAKKDQKIRAFREFYSSALGMPQAEALAFARQMVK